jgi:hypothetical protein
MQYWIFCISPATYPGVLKHKTVGVRENVIKRFRKIKKGDAFIVYVSKDKVFSGYGTIKSDTFEENTLIFSKEKVFPNRVKVKFEESKLKKPAKELLFGLKPFEESWNPGNLIMCKGGFIEIDKGDYQWLLKEIKKAS